MKRTKHPNCDAPESRFDDLPNKDKEDFVRIPFEDISMKDNQSKMLDALRKDGFFVISLPVITVEDIINPLFGSMKTFFGEEIAAERDELLNKRTKHALVETVESKKYRMIYKDGVHFGYTRIFFDNYDNRRDPEERDAFEVHISHIDNTIFPSVEFKELSVMAYQLLHLTAIQTLQGIAASLGTPFSSFSKVLTKEGKEDVNPVDNYASNLTLFRYNDDRKSYTTSQKCMVHRDGGLITLLVRSSVPGIELLSKDQSHFISIEKFTKPNDVIVFSGLLMEYLTQGVIQAAIHRVVREPGAERYSLPFEMKAVPEACAKKIDTQIIREIIDATPTKYNNNVYEPVVHGAICDNCMLTLTSTRHKCTTCADYDLCDSCLSLKGVHNPSHSFLKIDKDVPVFFGKEDIDIFVFNMAVTQQRNRQKAFRLDPEQILNKVHHLTTFSSRHNQANPTYTPELNQND